MIKIGDTAFTDINEEVIVLEVCDDSFMYELKDKTGLKNGDDGIFSGNYLKLNKN